MPTMTIRNIEPDTHAFYRQEAARNGRSMEEEVRQLLEENRKRRSLTGKEILTRIRARAMALGGVDDLVDAMDAVPRPSVPDPISFDE